jgi:B12-binding domain/radical SAM domain protein
MNYKSKILKACLIFPFSKINANGISALVASLDVHEELQNLDLYFPELNTSIEVIADEILNKYEFFILAVSVYTTQLEKYRKYIRSFKEMFSSKQFLVLAGGPHSTGDPLSMLLNGADISCIGEGEQVIRDVIISFLSNQDYSIVKSIAYLKGQQIIKTNKAPPLDLEDYPPFSVKHKIFRPIEITRGCAWKCRFCQIRSNGRPVRHRSIEQIIEYVKYTMKFFEGKRIDIRFISPNALSYGSLDGKTLNLSYLQKMLQTVRDVLGDSNMIYFGSFPSEVRPETITPKSVKLLKKFTNSKTIILGGQSGSDKVLLESDRGHLPEDTLKAAKLLIDSGFKVDVDIIFGLPGEEEEDINLTIDHMKELVDLGVRIHSHTFMPLVGTPFASKEPGKIHENYKIFLPTLHQGDQIKGQHQSQMNHAQDMATRRQNEKTQKEKFEKIKL